MPHFKRRFTADILKLLDVLCVALSFALATGVTLQARTNIGLVAFLSVRTTIANFLIFTAAILLYYVVFEMSGLYQSRRLSSVREELVDIVKGVTISLALFTMLGLLCSIKMLTPFLLVSFWAINILMLCAGRAVLRTLLGRVRAKGRNLRHLLVLGTNPRAVAFAQKVMASPASGYHLLGFVDDEWEGAEEFRKSGFAIVADHTSVAEFLRRNVVDEAVVYLPFGSFYREWAGVAVLCAHHGITLRVNSDTLGLKNARWLVEESDGGHYIATLTGAGEGWPLMVKRALDVLVSSGALLVLLPLLLAAAVAIKLNSPGPVFFLQERIGVNKRRFKIFKFRTMVPNAEKLMATLESKNEVTGPVFKMKNDPRITSIGRFLRRSSIDELPQLINVLKGDMSLVGPRPLPVRDYEGFSEDWQRRRFSVKPGITCLWQVSGRSGISFDQWMLLDVQYMDQWSLWLDLKILAKTVPAVLKGQGAA